MTVAKHLLSLEDYKRELLLDFQIVRTARYERCLCCQRQLVPEDQNNGLGIGDGISNLGTNLAWFPAHTKLLGPRRRRKLPIQPYYFVPAERTSGSARRSFRLISLAIMVKKRASKSVKSLISTKQVSLLTLLKRAQQERPRPRQTHSML